MSLSREKLREDLRYRILRLLEEAPELSQRDLARLVGVSTGGIHYILHALIAKGLIKLGNFAASEDKRRYAYVLTPSGIKEKIALTRRFLLRKMAEHDAIKAEIDQILHELGEDARSQFIAEHGRTFEPDASVKT